MVGDGGIEDFDESGIAVTWASRWHAVSRICVENFGLGLPVVSNAPFLPQAVVYAAIRFVLQALLLLGPSLPIPQRGLSSKEDTT
jgi:hypothetical protein